MKKNTEDKENKTIALSLGLYPGILFGVRTYTYENAIQYVFYLPFIVQACLCMLYLPTIIQIKQIISLNYFITI